MKRTCFLLFALPLLLSATASAGEKTFGSIIGKDPRFDKLIPKDAKIEKLADGFKWTEGPVWVRHGEFLLFSDIPNNRINKWKQGAGVKVFIEPAGYTGTKPRGGEPGTNGLVLDGEGRLVACDHGERRVWRYDFKTNEKHLLVDKYMGKRFNSPNDLVF